MKRNRVRVMGLVGACVGMGVVAASQGCDGTSAAPANVGPAGTAPMDSASDGGPGSTLTLSGDASADVDADAVTTPGADASTAGPDAGGPAALSTIHYLGRFDTTDPAGPRCSWPGSAIAATFTGTGISVTLTDSGGNVFTSVIDKGAPKSVTTAGTKQTYVLASGLAAGTHTLLLTKRTEPRVGVVQLVGLSPKGGALVPSPEPYTRRIEFIGDSITCGYGVLGADETCHFSAATEDETVAYGALTAAQLGAEQTVIAYSGIGVYRNNDGTTTNTMPLRYGRTLADDASSVWGFTTPQPDVIVITLGTNDFGKGDPGAPLASAYLAFVKMLRTHHPTSQIVCMSSPMADGAERTELEGDLRSVVQRLNAAGDARVTLLTYAADGGTDLLFATQNPAVDGLGCDYHPSAKTQKRMADALAPALKTLMGW